jgi:anti-sigma B factor antagonist
MADTDAIEVVIEERDGASIVRPRGDVDLQRSPVLREQLKAVSDRKPKKLVVDLSEVSYMDSSGVATLVEAMQLARRGNYTLVLCSLQDRVKSIFEIARLETVFQIAPDLETALQ